ncbi:hypothetical protein SVIO_013690 [Streptomyces violaceusniger]|uniref:Uncharacterized protein n=1 Tax=Streptomyces violaceusniger TaxID=68280 RepID=A0A4D4KV48_STRVO|nr:hypothetical protein SVIO_013690 [Streptomyces violaceusniger]
MAGSGAPGRRQDSPTTAIGASVVFGEVPSEPFMSVTPWIQERRTPGAHQRNAKVCAASGQDSGTGERDGEAGGERTGQGRAGPSRVADATRGAHVLLTGGP